VLNAATPPVEKTLSKKMDAVGEKMDALGESIDDASITALVKTTLLYHRSTSALNTTVETKGGVVKLGGKAGNAAEKDLATKLVSDVHGVKKVVNNMTV
jgi:osmotically-inducible protein OsmY